jgi:hypothetical protein
MDFGTYTWSWSCFDGSNTSPFSGIPEGGYTTQLQLLGPNNEILSTTPAATYQMAHCAPTVVSVDFGVN